MYALLQRPMLTATAASTGRPVYHGCKNCLSSVFWRDTSAVVLALACCEAHAAWLSSMRALYDARILAA